MSYNPKDFLGYEYKGLKIYPRLDLLKVYKTIGNSANPVQRKENSCIFCGNPMKGNNRSRSHLIPELFGKNSSRNDFECDNCNFISGKWESSMGTFLTPLRIIGRVRNKNGKIPKFKSRRDKFESSTEFYIDESGKLKGKLATMNDFQLKKDGTGEILFRLGSANPFHIYKVFLKIGLSLMPEEVLDKESWMKRYLVEDKLDAHIFPCIYKIYTYKIIFPKPSFELKRLVVHHKYHPQLFTNSLLR